MKAFIALKNNQGINSEIDDRFGRANYFLIYDLDEQQILSLEENRHRTKAQGVGIAVSNQVLQSNCQLAIGAQPGPKAESILRQGKVEFYKAENCTAAEAIEKYRQQQES